MRLSADFTPGCVISQGAVISRPGVWFHGFSTPPPCDFTHFCEFTPQHTKTHPTDESHGGVGAQGVEPSWTLRLRVWQSRLVGVAVGCEARPTRGIDAARGMGDRLSRVFVLHDTPKFVALGVEYAIAERGPT